LLGVALDLWKPTTIQDNQQFIDLCWVIVEEIMGQQTFSEVLLEILTETFVNIASFFTKFLQVQLAPSQRKARQLGEEIHSVCQISARKAEITLLARNFDCIASTLCSTFMGWPAQSLATTQPGKDEWHARRS
jgi:hypothetical protein